MNEAELNTNSNKPVPTGEKNEDKGAEQTCCNPQYLHKLQLKP